MVTATVASKLEARKVPCRHCEAMGKSITAYMVMPDGRLVFLGRLVNTMAYDPRSHEMEWGCRVCGQPIVVRLT